MGNDLISREAAKEKIREKIQTGKKDGCLRYRSMKNFIEGLEYAIDLLDCVQSTEVKHERTGHWIKKYDDQCYWFACSECGQEVLQNRFGQDDFSSYCPNCGAKISSDDEPDDVDDSFHIEEA